ncbi:MAG: DUF1801 domain-containing protein [Flavobacteriales bacterium]|jgi:hypothetical protein|nr:DUF1801 domain-containing protein [Flavobacteriales bacterium]
MAKAELKTKENDASVEAFIAEQSEEVAADCRAIMKLMKKITGEEPRMWGASIVGFGRYHYKGASGREGEWMLTGFSPRKANLSLYILTGLDKSAAQLKKLGKHSTGKGCLYFRRLSDVDAKVLEELIVKGVKGLEKMRVR